MNRFAILLAIALSACTAWPELPAASTPTGSASWPRLEPLNALLSEEAVADDDDALADALLARAARLRARAAILRGDASDLDALRSNVAR